jgi:hypothetical protein
MVGVPLPYPPLYDTLTGVFGGLIPSMKFSGNFFGKLEPPSLTGGYFYDRQYLFNMDSLLTESEKEYIRNLYNLHEQTLSTSYVDKECYKEYPNATVYGIKNALSDAPNTIRSLNIDTIKYSNIDLVILSKLICVLNQTLYSVYVKKWQKEINEKLYIDISNLISSKCSGLLNFKDGIDKFRDRYDNFKRLIDEVYK